MYEFRENHRSPTFTRIFGTRARVAGGGVDKCNKTPQGRDVVVEEDITSATGYNSMVNVGFKCRLIAKKNNKKCEDVGVKLRGLMLLGCGCAATCSPCIRVTKAHKVLFPIKGIGVGNMMAAHVSAQRQR